MMNRMTNFKTTASLAALALFLCGTAVLPAMAVENPVEKSEQVKITQDQLRQIDVTTTTLKTFVPMRTAIGQIAFNEDASTAVLTPFSGRVTRLLKKVGEDVTRGEPLFEIDSPEVVQAQTDFIGALQAVEKAKSQLRMTKSALDRQLSLMAGKATSQRDVDQATNDHAASEADNATAQGALTAARNRLRVIIGRDGQEIERLERERIVNPLITINAPIDGTVIARKIGPGQFVRSDGTELLYSISDLSVMWLKAYVPESEIASVQVGQSLEVKVSALPNRTFHARVSSIGASSDPQTRRIVVRSEIANPDRLLKADMFATFRIGVDDGTARPCVPIVSIIRNGEDASVWIEKEPRVFERRAVQIGNEYDGFVQITAGLNPGDRVVGRGAIFVDNELK